MTAFGLILSLAGVILLIAGAAQAVQNHNFRDARRVTGTVLNKRSRQTKAGRAYLLRLAYSVEDTAYEREVGVSASEYDALTTGQSYEVQYRPGKPEKILRLQNTNPRNVKGVLFFGVALIAAGVLLIFLGRM